MNGLRLLPFIVRLPLLILWLVGIGIAIFRWRRHPQASILAIIGFMLIICSSTIDFYAPMTMNAVITQAKGPALGTLVNVLIFTERTSYCLGPLAWILLLLALFRKRPETA